MFVVVLADGESRDARGRVAGFEAVADGVALVFVGVDAAIDSELVLLPGEGRLGRDT